MKHLCENCPLYPCIWTTVRSLNTPQDGYLFPVTPKDLDGFNKELPTLELHGVLKKSFLDIFEWEMSV